MLVTFVIGLREGLEAALIVAIVAAFLIKNSDRRALRPMWAGVAGAVGICIAAALTLHLIGERLPVRAREAMEGGMTILAVIGVTYMLVWMRRHSTQIKTDLQERAARALDSGSTWALVVLAFVAVLREGLETAVFLLGILTGSSNAVVGLVGAAAGIAVASLIGYGIYRGGVRIDLARFFRFTGVLLVVVAAGLLSSAIHEFAEAGMFTIGQTPAIDLSGLIAPGSVQAGLATAFLGFQPVPTYAELTAWLIFLIPAAWYVLRPVQPARRLAT
jgi:high-affinity iron transporter